jgi:sugar (pentulose or hexulose) kinase
MGLLLGIDAGTSAVKAVLFDADLRPLQEAVDRTFPPGRSNINDTTTSADEKPRGLDG